MSQAGLFMSLLYELISQRRDIIPIVFRTQWEALCLFGPNKRLEFSEATLRDKLLITIQILARDSKVCLFVDGLDEFGGNSEILVALFKSLVDTTRRLKICVASRPWVIFEDAFGQNPSLRVEDLTYDDIKGYVSSNFDMNAEFSKLRDREPDFANHLIGNIVDKASGVFLWVQLVVTSLLSGLKFGDRVVDLQRRLDTLPGDLEMLFDKILQNLDPFYLTHAAQYFQFVEAAKEPIPILWFSFSDEENLKSAIEMPVQISPEKMTFERIEAMKRRLNSRCKGLLDVERGFRVADQSLGGQSALTVQYLHRTVKDFIQSAKAQQLLQPVVEKNFDPHLNLCIGFLVYVKRRVTDGPQLIKGLRTCIYSAAHILARSELQMIAILDELAKTFPAEALMAWRTSVISLAKNNHFLPDLSSLDREWQSVPWHGNGRWSDVPRTYLENDFIFQKDWGRKPEEMLLSLAAVHDIPSYITAKLKSDAVGKKSCRVMASSLLWDAVSASKVNIMTIDFLLNNEAVPDFPISRLDGQGDSTPHAKARYRQTHLRMDFLEDPVELSRQEEKWRMVLDAMARYAGSTKSTGGLLGKFQNSRIMERLSRRHKD